MKFFTPSYLKSETSAIRYEGMSGGESTGWKSLDSIFTVKKGYPLFIAGSPHHGKTEFVLELLLNLSKSLGWKHFVYSGEAGSVAELISELAHKFVGKPYRKLKDDGTPSFVCMTDGELIEAEMFIENHFLFLDTEHEKSKVDEFTIEEFYNLVDEAEKEYGIRFDTTLIDPFNDVFMDLKPFGGRQDLWLTDGLKCVRRNAKQRRRVNIIVNHIADISPVTDKETGHRYTPIALPTEWSGGRTWHRRAFTMLLIYRPPVFLKNDNGVPYLENETVILNQKAKPKGSGRLGQASLFWDWKKNRFYEMEYVPIQFPEENITLAKGEKDAF